MSPRTHMEITEDWVRGLTGWKPFREGKSMADRGLIVGFKRNGPSLQGSLREGRLTLRPVVKIVGPSDVRVQCGCPDHRATGGVCAHAVAVLITALQTAVPAVSSDRPRSEDKRATVTTAPPKAWKVRLSPKIADELRQGKLSVRLVPDPEALLTPSDVALSGWLEERGQSTVSSAALAFRVAGEDAAALLDRLAGHPRVEIDGRPGKFELPSEPGPPLRLADSRLEGFRVALTLATEESRDSLVRWGPSVAAISNVSITRLPGGSPRAGWVDHVITLVNRGELRLALSDFLPDLDAWLDVFQAPHSGWLGRLRFAGSEPDFVLTIEGSLDAVEASLSVVYPGLGPRLLPEPGDELPGLPSLGPDGQLRSRSVEAEEAARHTLALAGLEITSQRSRFRLTGRDAILSFVADQLPVLRKRWTVREGERFAAVLKRVHVVSPHIAQKADLGSSLLLDISFQTTGGQRIPSTEIRRLLSGGKRRVTTKSGAELVVSRSCDEMVLPLARDFGIGRLDEPVQVSGAAIHAFQNLRDILLKHRDTSGLDEIDQCTAAFIQSIDLNASLRPYQAQGIAWLRDRLKHLQGALLADEMGLGKTIQAIASIVGFNRDSPAGGPSLVVVPTSLVGNWISEIGHFAPRLKALRFHGSERDTKRGQVDDVDVVVTSYGTFVRDLAFHLQREYRLVIADEASILRNPDSEASKALSKVKASAKLALTGTPVENRMQDLWGIFRFIAPGYLGDRTDFRELYEQPAADPAVAVPTLKRLRVKISPFVIRRTKEQVAKDLPEKIEIDEWLTLPDAQATLYASVARSGLHELERMREKQGENAGQMHLLTLLLRLRQICVDPALLKLPGEEVIEAAKVDRLEALLGERFEDSRKTLVFSQFAENLRNIERRLGDRLGQLFRLDGSTRDRQGLVNSFQSHQGPAVFLISLKAGGYGLNLTAADAVVHMDPWWNPAAEAQATDRAHRIGQTRPVTVYRLLTRDTVEERVRRLQDHKRALIEATTGEDAAPTNWNRNDLESLLR